MSPDFTNTRLEEFYICRHEISIGNQKMANEVVEEDIGQALLEHIINMDNMSKTVQVYIFCSNKLYLP